MTSNKICWPNGCYPVRLRALNVESAKPPLTSHKWAWSSQEAEFDSTLDTDASPTEGPLLTLLRPTTQDTYGRKHKNKGLRRITNRQRTRSVGFRRGFIPKHQTAQENQCQLSESATDRIRFPYGVLPTQRRNTKSDNGRDLTKVRYSSTLRNDAPFLRDYKYCVQLLRYIALPIKLSI